ncbi:hypothetical protein LZ633_20305 [Enterobacter asburiae]|nr:hypothetical protein [Enterobacter asburiae]
MSAKSQFLKKLQSRQPSAGAFKNKSEADIAAFRLRMGQLQEKMTGWLVDTGVTTDSFSVSLADLLVPGGAFDMPGILLRFEGRAVKFTPLFLYGHGVTGCVEIALCAEGKNTPLGRLFMCSGELSEWTCRLAGPESQRQNVFDEEAFFSVVEGLLP